MLIFQLYWRMIKMRIHDLVTLKMVGGGNVTLEKCVDELLRASGVGLIKALQPSTICF